MTFHRLLKTYSSGPSVVLDQDFCLRWHGGQTWARFVMPFPNMVNSSVCGCSGQFKCYFPYVLYLRRCLGSGLLVFSMPDECLFQWFLDRRLSWASFLEIMGHVEDLKEP